MRSKPLRHAAALLLTVGLIGAGCAPTTQVHGYVPPAADVARVTPGVDTRATVGEIIGLPSSTGLLQDRAWYYVQSVFESYAYNPPRVVDRTVLVVGFDANGVVSDVDSYGVEDGRIVNLSTRITETGGREFGVLEQLFGNILNLDAEQFTDE